MKPTRQAICALCSIACFYLILERCGITCPILALTGISCAGCGMTRAWLSLFHLDFIAAFHYHPLFWLPIPALGLFLLHHLHRIKPQIFRLCIIIICGLFLLVYFFRLLDPTDFIVIWNPRQGLIVQTFSKLFDSI